MIPFKGVLFDMDGVLVDNNRFHRQAWKETAKELLGLDLSEHDLDTKVDGGRNPEIQERLTGKKPTPEEAQHLHNFKEDLYRKAAKGNMQEVAGLSAYLQLLQDAGIPYAMVTSADRVNVEFGLTELGLSHAFPLRIMGEDVQNGKPHPEPYLKGAALLGFDPRDCLVHEDAIFGVQSGVNSGATVCALSTTQTEEKLREAGAKWVVRDFLEWMREVGSQ
ncbi:HAD family hydrolase [Deinococcus cellulosilyticus]|uniref:Hydrolase n=1 Tax=Deinococcus cellulosilyticus (strain DSM 18568 / NBRC 106333 / KACC 11606 / 5516J-15) TaxID=1223518 RepID=A0A511MYZ2_DEIC1|nr:HAD family phosphatase [Deinococcus cellulosilyticus]GEM45752.1 hydrolase [Deinococcus cellulosilyticus NBRC 106333 = KACC 11606]